MLILTSGHYNKKFFRNCEEIIRIFFSVLGIDLSKRLYVPNMEARKDILKEEASLKKAFEYGASLVNHKKA
jgi:hypothetical protein